MTSIGVLCSSIVSKNEDAGILCYVSYEYEKLIHQLKIENGVMGDLLKTCLTSKSIKAIKKKIRKVSRNGPNL